ncbi:MAG: hypothetical protein U5K27_02060 [Desulfotignum sp.]|nr:hypothetical protein [Desulfotignum sp.]
MHVPPGGIQQRHHHRGRPLPAPAGLARWHHAMSIPSLQARILDTLEKNPSSSALLMTGADMDHVAP